MTAAKKIEVTMMKGTEGKKDYMAFAAKNGMALGIKPVAIADGGRLGVPETTWFGARLRSATEKGVFEEAAEEGESNVVTFKKTADSPAGAWPNITWEKKDDKRASTTIGVLLPGSHKSSAQAKQLMVEIEDKKLATKMVDYLEFIVGKENFVISRDDAIEWFDAQYAPILKTIKTAVSAQENVSAEMKASIGSFNMHAELLNKAYKKTKSEVDPDEIEDLDAEQEDEDDEEEDDAS